MAEVSFRLHRQDRCHRFLLRRRHVEYLGRPLGADLAAAVPYYGAVPSDADIPKIKAAILAHHGALDTRLASTWPAYDKALTAINVPHEGYIYPDSVHGFNCDATPERYNKAASIWLGNARSAGLTNTRKSRLKIASVAREIHFPKSPGRICTDAPRAC